MNKKCVLDLDNIVTVMGSLQLQDTLFGSLSFSANDGRSNAAQLFESVEPSHVRGACTVCQLSK